MANTKNRIEFLDSKLTGKDVAAMKTELQNLPGLHMGSIAAIAANEMSIKQQIEQRGENTNYRLVMLKYSGNIPAYPTLYVVPNNDRDEETLKSWGFVMYKRLK